MVLIEGVNDTQEELQLMAQLLQEAAPGVSVRVVPFSPHGVRPEYGHLRAPPPDTVLHAQQMLASQAQGPPQGWHACRLP